MKTWGVLAIVGVVACGGGSSHGSDEPRGGGWIETKSDDGRFVASFPFPAIATSDGMRRSLVNQQAGDGMRFEVAWEPVEQASDCDGDARRYLATDATGERAIIEKHGDECRITTDARIVTTKHLVDRDRAYTLVTSFPRDIYDREGTDEFFRRFRVTSP